MGVGTPSFAAETEDEVLLFRDAYWQLAERWLRVPQTSHLPLVYTYANAGTGARIPLRPLKPTPGTTIYERRIAHLRSTFALRVVDAGNEADVATFSSWQNSPRVAAAWRQTGTLEEHREYLERMQADAHTVPVLGSFGGEDALYAELYWVAEDHVASHVPHLDAFDRGVHLLVGSEKHRGAHHVAAWAASLAHALFLMDTRTQRVVMEPRASNAKIVRCMSRAAGFVHTRTFDFAHKRAALLELSRERFFALAPFGFDGELPVRSGAEAQTGSAVLPAHDVEAIPEETAIEQTVHSPADAQALLADEDARVETSDAVVPVEGVEKGDSEAPEVSSNVEAHPPVEADKVETESTSVPSADLPTADDNSSP
ncbi:hypothetical protein EXIGLDRAFT_611976 [Exidia glandulosa HHB12029]|uniref:Acyltransferase MbtK/IucB-like conserved domain-containing protein n=1 Tax=Exidia glandulosa HHB12029 TaxID=1314781 RepID=A0A165J357_EXIGL|nr:hypothetical protein EXIGLDRAFT_611976 [Exidia glandulosa HHB12029]